MRWVASFSIQPSILYPQQLDKKISWNEERQSHLWMKIQNRFVLLCNFGLAHRSLFMFAFLGQHLEPCEELQRGTRRWMWKGQKGNTQKYMIVLLFPHHSSIACMQYIYWWQEGSGTTTNSWWFQTFIHIIIKININITIFNSKGNRWGRPRWQGLPQGE